MKKTTILILILTMLTACGREKNNLVLIDSWYNSEGKLDGMTTLIRGRDSLKNIYETGYYTTRIEIEWTFSDRNKTGMPSKTESILMEKFENALIPSLEKDLQSILVSVFTWNNTRTWFFYTTSVDEFKVRLESTLKKTNMKLPLRTTTIKDAHWTEYKSILEGSGLKMK